MVAPCCEHSYFEKRKFIIIFVCTNNNNQIIKTIDMIIKWYLYTYRVVNLYGNLISWVLLCSWAIYVALSSVVVVVVCCYLSTWLMKHTEQVISQEFPLSLTINKLIGPKLHHGWEYLWQDRTELFANFCLTHRWNQLLYTVRKAHEDGKIEKYFSDYDGSIVLVTKGSTRKIQLTSVANKANGFRLQTYMGLLNWGEQ